MIEVTRNAGQPADCATEAHDTKATAVETQTGCQTVPATAKACV